MPYLRIGYTEKCALFLHRIRALCSLLNRANQIGYTFLGALFAKYALFNRAHHMPGTLFKKKCDLHRYVTY